MMLLIVVALACCASCTLGRRPNLVHIVADDVGWNDLGISNSAMHTPTIDGLMKDGITLTHFYAQKECAPSRSSIMTGRLPFRYGYYQNPSDDGGVPYNYTMLPEVLQLRGYRTHAIGKWHCGFRTPRHTPTQRGFETFVGFWHWGEEYVDHAFPPYYKNAKCRGVDFVNASGKNIQPALGYNGTSSTVVFLQEFERVVLSHPVDTPLYVYLAFQNAHDPYEHAPAELVDTFPADMEATRRNYSAIVEDLDRGVAKVAQLLKTAGLWENTLIWFNSDNGGELPFADQTNCNKNTCSTGCCGGAGNNYPLRGGKFTLFEGGIRARAFVYSPSSELLPQSRRGGTWSGLAHVSDVFATMAGLAGAEIEPPPDPDSEPYAEHGGLGSMVAEISTDGFDLWAAIANGTASPRNELLHQPLNKFWNQSCIDGDVSNPFQPSCGASITVWPYKLLIGFPGDSRVVRLPADDVVPNTPRRLCEANPCLFNLETDPSESLDLALHEPAAAQRLLHRLHALSVPQADPQPPDALTPVPSDAACAKVQATGVWLPWQETLVSGLAYYA